MSSVYVEEQGSSEMVHISFFPSGCPPEHFFHSVCLDDCGSSLRDIALSKGIFDLCVDWIQCLYAMHDKLPSKSTFS